MLALGKDKKKVSQRTDENQSQIVLERARSEGGGQASRGMHPGRGRERTRKKKDFFSKKILSESFMHRGKKKWGFGLTGGKRQEQTGLSESVPCLLWGKD